MMKTEETLSIIAKKDSILKQQQLQQHPRSQISPVQKNRQQNQNLVQEQQLLDQLEATGGVLGGVLQNNSGISRTRLKGLNNSQSNKRMPTWKAP